VRDTSETSLGEWVLMDPMGNALPLALTMTMTKTSDPSAILLRLGHNKESRVRRLVTRVADETGIPPPRDPHGKNRIDVVQVIHLLILPTGRATARAQVRGRGRRCTRANWKRLL